MTLNRVFVAAGIDPQNPYGPHTRPFYLSKYLSRVGVQVYATTRSYNPEFELRNLLVVRSESARWPILRYPLKSIELSIAVKRVNPDLVYAHTPSFGVVMSMPRNPASHRRPVVLDMHGSWRREQRESTNYRLLTIVENFAIQRADFIVAASDELRSYLIGAYDLDPHFVSMVPNGVDTEIFWERSDEQKSRLRSSLGFDHNKVIILPAPRNFRYNVTAIEFMYSVMRNLAVMVKDAVLLITGGGPEIGKVPLNVKYIGRVLDLSAYLSASDVGVLPYPSGTFCGGARNKALEYFQCGLPTVSTRDGVFGIQGLRDHEDYFLSEDNPRDFALKIAEAFSLPRDERSKMATRTKRIVARQYSWEKQAKLLESILNRFVDSL